MFIFGVFLCVSVRGEDRIIPCCEIFPSFGLLFSKERGFAAHIHGQLDTPLIQLGSGIFLFSACPVWRRFLWYALFLRTQVLTRASGSSLSCFLPDKGFLTLLDFSEKYGGIPSRFPLPPIQFSSWFFRDLRMSRESDVPASAQKPNTTKRQVELLIQGVYWARKAQFLAISLPFFLSSNRQS